MASNCPKSNDFNPFHKKQQDEPKIMIKRCPYCSLTIMQNQDTCPREECNRDRSLMTWDKWVRERQNQTLHLANETNRPPVDLVMNLLENVRQDKERKVALEHAQIKKKVAIRGGTLWEQPLRLKQLCPCKPVYEVQRTNAELGKPRIIEHIGVPEMIKVEEKGLSGVPERLEYNKLDRDYVNYREKRENDLKDKIKKIDPHRPFIDGLIVKGSKPIPPPKKMPAIPVISFAVDSEPPRYSLSGVHALKINKSIFFKELQGQHLTDLKKTKEDIGSESCSNWTYYFNVPIKRAGRSKLYLENLGTVALRYCWKKLRKPIPFIPEDVQEQVFFFNKNEDVLSPGQNKNIVLTFFSKKIGLFSEIWELSVCNFNFFDNMTGKFIINLNADVTEEVESIKQNVKGIKRGIVRAAKLNIAKSIIDDIVIKATVIKPETYAYKKMMLEADIFKMKNPMCFYHQTEVQKMKDIYGEMLPNEEWDLSIGTWRKAMMEKEFDDRMMYFESLKRSHSELLKPWQEGDGLLVRKYRAVSQLLGQLADLFSIQYDLIAERLGVETNAVTAAGKSVQRIASSIDQTACDTIRAIFYMSMRDHVATTIEQCAGVISSMDRDRWIDFDFCRFY